MMNQAITCPHHNLPLDYNLKAGNFHLIEICESCAKSNIQVTSKKEEELNSRMQKMEAFDRNLQRFKSLQKMTNINSRELQEYVDPICQKIEIECTHVMDEITNVKSQIQDIAGNEIFLQQISNLKQLQIHSLTKIKKKIGTLQFLQTNYLQQMTMIIDQMELE